MSRIRRPPGPSGNWLFGVTPFRAPDPLKLLTDWAHTYGDTYHYRLLHFHVYFFNSPESIEQILVAQQRKFVKGRAMQANRDLFGNGLLTSEGDYWQHQRKLIQPAFHRERIAAYGRTMVSSTQRMLDAWTAALARETNPHIERDIHQEMMALTLDIAARTLFNVEIAHETERIGRALEILLAATGRPGRMLRIVRMIPFPSERAYRRAVRDLDEIVYGIIHARRAAGGDSGDLLAMLLAAKDENGNGMTDRQLRDEALTLLLAGHETTAIALSWAWYLLSQNPEVSRKFHAELDSVLAVRAPAVEDLPRLPYTERVIKEAMRLYPPAYVILRLAVEDSEIGGYRVPRGSSVAISPWVIHRDPRFFPEPERFNPDRWTPDFQRALPRFAYFPFGGGPRICIGAQFASMEAALVLATIAQRYNLRLVPGHPVETFPSMTLRPRHGLRMTLHAR
jgi:cytochrome P450